MLGLVPEIDRRTRELMRDTVAKSTGTPLQSLIRQVTHEVNGFSDGAKTQFFNVLDKIPMAFQKTNAIFATPEKKKPGGGGIFSIFVSDLCKGCAACVTACGEHDALRMVQETEEVNAEHESGTAFLDLLPDTPQKYLGLYNDSRPQDSKTATLAQHAHGAPQLRRARIGRRRVRRVRREEHPAGLRGGDRSVHAAAVSREGRSLPRESGPTGEGGRAEAGRDQGAQPGGVRPAAPGRGAPAHGARRRGRSGHQGADGRIRSDLRSTGHRRDHGGHAAGGVQSQEPPAHRRPAGQRHVGHGDGSAHGLQHRVRIDAAQQPASVSLDEFALPGRHHRRLAHGRELHRRSRETVGDPRAPGRCAVEPHGRGDQPTRVLRVRRTSATRS